MAQKFLSAEEISSFTGLSVQFYYSEIYKAKIFGNGIPYHKFGPRAVRFDPNEVIPWLETRHHEFHSLKEAVRLSKEGKTDSSLEGHQGDVKDLRI
jgi:predicted DNA-binding transcriptional regulator AlpA